MSKKTITKKWAEDSQNKVTFNDSDIQTGIGYRSQIVSNILNGFGNLTWEFLDNLQKAGTAWNLKKTYNNGDAVVINVVLNSKNLLALLVCKQDNTKTAPLSQIANSTLTINNDYNLPLFTITSTANKMLKDFVNSGWLCLNIDLNVDTILANSLNLNNDLSIANNATISKNLLVNGDTTLKNLTASNLTINGQISATNEVILNANLQVKNNATIAKNLITDGTIKSARIENAGELQTNSQTINTNALIKGNLTNQGTIQSTGNISSTHTITSPYGIFTSLTADNFTLKNNLSINGTFYAKNTASFATPERRADSTQGITAEWFLDKLASINVCTGKGKKTWSFVINMSSNRNGHSPYGKAVTLADDAVGKSSQQLINELGLTHQVLLKDYFIRIPLMGIYMRPHENGRGIICSITNDTEAKNYYQYYAFYRGDTLSNYLYYGKYHSILQDNTIYSKQSSTQTPYTDTLYNHRVKALGKGSGYNISNFYQRQLINALCVLVYNTLDFRTKFGTGRYSISAIGEGIYYNQWEIAKQNDNQNVFYLGCCNLHGNVWEQLEGIYVQNNQVFTTASGFNTDGGGYIYRGYCPMGYQGYFTNIAGNNELLFFPQASTDGTANRYYCSKVFAGASAGVNHICKAGGSFEDGKEAVNLFSFSYDNHIDENDNHFGSRLVLLKDD